MVITVRRTENATILDLKGRMGLGESIETFRNQFYELLNADTKSIAINLTAVPFIDSSGIGALVGAFTTAGARGAKCIFFAASGQVLHALQVSRLDDVLGLFADETSALASF